MAEAFTHLHVARALSANAGVSRPDQFVSAAAADGATALAFTDRDGLYGAVKHIAACRNAGIDPIVGVDLPVLAEPEDDDEARPSARKQRRGAAGVAGRVVVLAHGRNRGAGWRALCRLVSDAHAHTSGRANSRVPVGVLRSELAARCLDRETGRPVLTVLIGPDSDVGRAMSGTRFLRPRTLFRAWLDAMPVGVLAVELVTHLTSPGQALSTAHAVRMLRLASEHAVPAVLTNAVCRVREDGVTEGNVPDAERTPIAEHGWLKPAAQMRELGREIIRAAGLGGRDLAHLLGNTERIADRSRLDPVADVGWGRPVMPESSVMGLVGEPHRELAERCRAAIGRRFPGLPGAREEQVHRRLEHELQIIGSLGLGPYFLTVAEVAGVIRGLGVRSAARGSGRSSLVNYLLGISHVDPLLHNLSFEHLLPQERSAFPAIGLDVESAQWRKVSHGIFARFGAGRVAVMATQDAPPARGGVSGEESGEMDQQPELLDLTEGPARLPDHVSLQPCGVILGDARLLDRTPVQPSGLGLPVSQFDKHDMGPMGILGLDIVGVRLQSSMAFAVREAERAEGTRIDLDAVRSPSLAVSTHQAEWLKAHHPEAFLAGVFEHGAEAYPKGFLKAEAGRRGIPILPADINASLDEHRVEGIASGPDAGRLGIRLPLRGIGGLSEAELRRIVAGQPYGSIAEVRDRARLAPARIRRLAELGVFDSLHHAAQARGHRDLLAQLAQSAPRASSRADEPSEGQLSLELGDPGP